MAYKDINKLKAYRRLWYLKNKERKNKASHKYYIEHKRDIIKRTTLWAKQHPNKRKEILKRCRKNRYPILRDKILARHKEWEKNNPGETPTKP